MAPALMDELRKELIEMRRRRMSTDQIAEALNLSTDTVIWLLTHLEVNENREKPPTDILVDWSTIGGKPERTYLLGQMISDLVEEQLQIEDIDAVYGLAVDGIPLAQEVARNLSKPCVIVKPQGEIEFIMPFFDQKGKRVILVDHVINTGRTLSRVIEGLKETDTKPIGIFVFVDKRPWRKANENVAGVETHSLVRAFKA